MSADPLSEPLKNGRLLNLITQNLESVITGGSVFEITTSFCASLAAPSLAKQE